MPPKNVEIERLDDADNRYFPRWEVASRVRYNLENHPNFFEGQTRDISCSGVCIKISEDIRARQKINLTIYLSEVDRVNLTGHVVWLKNSGEDHEIGINFSDVTAEAQGLTLEHPFFPFHGAFCTDHLHETAPSLPA